MMFLIYEFIFRLLNGFFIKSQYLISISRTISMVRNYWEILVKIFFPLSPIFVFLNQKIIA